MQPLRKREEQWSKVEHHVIIIWEGFTPTEDTRHGRVEETNTEPGQWRHPRSVLADTALSNL